MGCNPVCKAKKKAKEGKAKAAAARNNPPKAPVGPAPTSSSATVITVADVLNLGDHSHSVTPQQMYKKLGEAKGNSLIQGNELASSLITPIKVAFGVYTGLLYAQVAYNILKPVVKMAMNIYAIVMQDYSNLAELLGDIGLLLLAIFVGLAPMFLNQLKKVFLSIPLDIGIINKYQLEQMKTLVSLSKIDITSAFTASVNRTTAKSAIDISNDKELTNAILGNNAITVINDVKFDSVGNRIGATYKDYSNDINNDIPFDEEELKEELVKGFGKGMEACKEVILEELNKKLNNIKVDILKVDGIANFDSENKNKAKTVAKGLLDATKKVETLQAAEILKRQFTVSGAPPNKEGEIFDDNDLAIAAVDIMIEKLNKEISLSDDGRKISVDDIFLDVLNTEVEKKKRSTTKVRESISAIETAEEIIKSNKAPFVSSINNRIDAINTTEENIELINNSTFCPETSINNEFILLKETILLLQTQTINMTEVSDTDDMTALRNTVMENVRQTVIDFLPIVDTNCLINFQENICKLLSNFKSILFRDIKLSIEKGDILLTNLDLKVGVSKYELKKTINFILVEIKKRLVAQTKDIVIDGIAICKSCRPCEDFTSDLNIKASETIEKFKDNVIKNVEGYIIKKPNDYSINNVDDIAIKKSLLINELNIALSKSSGVLEFKDTILYKLKAEEKELIKNVKISLKAL